MSNIIQKKDVNNLIESLFKKGLDATQIYEELVKGDYHFIGFKLNLQNVYNRLMRVKSLIGVKKLSDLRDSEPEVTTSNEESRVRETIKDKIETLKFELEELNIYGKELVKEVISRLKTQDDVTLNKDEVVEFLKEIDKDNSEFNEFNLACTTKDRYSTTPTHYIFYKRIEDIYGTVEIKEYPVKRSLVEKIYKDYSRHGIKDLSGQEIRLKYKLRPETWELLKNVLSLYKDSNVLPDDLLKELSTEDVEKKVEEVIEEGIQDKYINSYQKIYDRKMKLHTERALRMLGETEYLVKYVEEKIKEWPVRPYTPYKVKQTNSKYCVIGFGDVHKGLKTKKDGYKLETSAEIISERIREIGLVASQRQEDNIHFILNGDLFEAMQTGLMHVGQHLEMDLFGSDQFTSLLDDVEQMLIQTLSSGKKVNLRVKRGNHDRGSQNHDDKLGIFAIIFGVTLKRGLRNYIDKGNLTINYDGEDVSVDLIGRVNYISYHGDILRNGADINKVVVRYGYTQDSGIFNVIITSHLHSIETQEGINSFRLRLPSIATANGYAEGILGNSLPGYVIFTENSIGLPEYEVKRFNI